jgi:hypothetical protein
MKEGYIIYVVGDGPLHEVELKALISRNNLDIFEYCISGRKPLPGICRAYQDLQKRRVDAVNCLSVRFNRKTRNYDFLDQSMSLDTFSDISSLCSEQELAS